jgi:protein gp37
MGQPNYINGFKLTLHKDALMLPLSWKKPRTIFVNSMSDLFHEEVPDDFILGIFKIMRKAHWHNFQILTKRAKRLANMNAKIIWAPNIWMGVTIENRNYAYRIDYLKKTNAFTKFLSLEPLLGPLKHLQLNGIDWVIVGGESGPCARPMDKSWVIDILHQCREQSVPFFFKQWGGTNKKKAGRLLNGRTWDELPQNKQIYQQTIC